MSFNLLSQDETENLSLFTTKRKSLEFVGKKFELEHNLGLEDEFDSLDYQISEFQSSTVEYIAGYIKLQLPSKLTFKFCVEIVIMEICLISEAKI